MKTILLLFVISCFLFSCKKESQEDHINSFPVEVQQYVRDFLKEGHDRSVNLDIKKIHKIILTGPITTVDSDNGAHAAGYYCHHNDKKNKQEGHCIYLDTTSHSWLNDFRREMIFHELGHGVLHREHLTGFMPNEEDLVSIMDGKKVENIHNYLFKQQYYFDELFGKFSTFPSWAYQK